MIQGRLRESTPRLLIVAAVAGALLPDYRFDELSVLMKVFILPGIFGLWVTPKHQRGSDVLLGLFVVLAAITLNVAAQLWSFAWLNYDNIDGPFGVDDDTLLLAKVEWVAEAVVATIFYIARVMMRSRASRR